MFTRMGGVHVYVCSWNPLLIIYLVGRGEFNRGDGVDCCFTCSRAAAHLDSHLCSLSAAPVLTCVRARCRVQATTALALGGTILSMPMTG